MSDARDLPAGEFSAWMKAVQLAIRGEGASDVPCGSCTAWLHGIAVHSHRAGRDRHAGPHPGRRVVPRTAVAAGSRADGLRRARTLSDADRWEVLDLRAPPADLPHLRLSRLSGGRDRIRRRQGSHRHTGEPLELQLSKRRRPHSTRCCSRVSVVPPRASRGAPRRQRAGHRDPARRRRDRGPRRLCSARPTDRRNEDRRSRTRGSSGRAQSSNLIKRSPRVKRLSACIQCRAVRPIPQALEHFTGTPH